MQNKDDERRKRIELIKKFIVIKRKLTPYIFIILAVVCIFLLIQNSNLRKKITELKNGINIAGEEITGSPEYDDSSGVYSTQKVSKSNKKLSEYTSVDAMKYEGKKRVYLTFDDGPSVYTDDILDILNKYEVKGTFFVVANNDSYADDAYKRIVDEGHTLALHSYSHKYDEIYVSMETFKEDISSLQEFLYERTDVWPRIYRFPGGSSNTVSNTPMKDMISYLDKEGIVYYDWNIMSGDAVKGGVSENTIINNCLNGIEKHDECIILMHDLGTMRTTIEALDDIIEGINNRGDCVILPITDDTTPVQHIPERITN